MTKQSYKKSNNTNKKFCNKNGFSIAEAMIVLLIVSIAMAAMAPMISKKTLRSGGACEWIVTQNNLDIARPNSNVRIGGNEVDNPRARLDVISEDASAKAQRINIPNGQTADILRIYKTGSGAGIDGVIDLIARINPNGTYSPISPQPSGMVAYFDATACPVGWVLANGSQVVGVSRRDLRGRFLKAWDGSGSVGSLQDDSIQEHNHDYYIMMPRCAGTGTCRGNNQFGLDYFYNLYATLTSSAPDTNYFNLDEAYKIDDAHPVKVSSETQPKNISLLTCVKE